MREGDGGQHRLGHADGQRRGDIQREIGAHGAAERQQAVDAAGGVAEAVAKARSRWGGKFEIEVETRTIAEVRAAVGAGADRIMFAKGAPSSTPTSITSTSPPPASILPRR